MAQRHQRIDLRRQKGGDIGGQYGNADEKKRD